MHYLQRYTGVKVMNYLKNGMDRLEESFLGNLRRHVYFCKSEIHMYVQE